MVISGEVSLYPMKMVICYRALSNNLELILSKKVLSPVLLGLKYVHRKQSFQELSLCLAILRFEEPFLYFFKDGVTAFCYNPLTTYSNPKSSSNTIERGVLWWLCFTHMNPCLFPLRSLEREVNSDFMTTIRYLDYRIWWKWRRIKTSVLKLFVKTFS